LYAVGNSFAGFETFTAVTGARDHSLDHLLKKVVEPGCQCLLDALGCEIGCVSLFNGGEFTEVCGCSHKLNPRTIFAV